MSHRPVLSLYRRTFRIARTWTNEGEREYIRDEARRLVRRNAHLTDSSAIARKLSEFESRIDIGLHYKIASPRYPNVVPGATGLAPDTINPVYLDSFQGSNSNVRKSGGIANRAPQHHD